MGSIPVSPAKHVEIMKAINTYKKFQPATFIAVNNVRDLIVRGGVIINDHRDFIEIRRQESVAKIDRMGRVEWRQFHG